MKISKIATKLLAAATLVLCAVSGIAQSGPLDSWTLRTSSGAYKIAYGNERFVAVGSSSILVSTNGADWRYFLAPVLVNTPQATSADLTFANGQFLLNYYTQNYSNFYSFFYNVLFTSADGILWTKKYESSIEPTYISTAYPSEFRLGALARVVYGNAFYVGYNKNVYTSTTLTNWTLRVQGDQYLLPPFTSIAFGNGTFIGCNANGPTFASVDGAIWEYQLLGPSNIASQIKFANGRFAGLTAGTNGPDKVFTSFDGMFWNSASLTNLWADETNSSGISSNSAFAATADSFFLLPGENPLATDTFFASPDGLTWTAHSLGTTNNHVRDVAFGLNTFVAVGPDGIYQSAPVTNSDTPPSLALLQIPAVSITGMVGKWYRIEYADALTGTNNFQPLTNLLLTSSPLLWPDTTATNAPQRYYRAVQIQ
jgi:hypothetical protein